MKHPPRVGPLSRALVGLLALPWVAWAQEAAEVLGPYTPPETHHFSPSPTMLLLRTVGSLALVVALIGFCAWLARARGGYAARPAAGRLKLVESLPLGTNRALHLVACGDRLLLLGGGETLQCLATYTAAELDWSPTESATPSFESWLARLPWPGGEAAPAEGEAAT